jgi:predicted SnoaL-like aldol condensation-catalyzing enzyme
MSAADNRQTAIDFLRLALVEGEPELAVKRFVGATYTQHSPGAADGVDAFIAFAQSVKRDYPDLKLEICRTFAEGDLVALHTRVIGFGDSEHAAVDMYGFDQDGKIVEHWEVIQAVPASALNPNGMF